MRTQSIDTHPETERVLISLLRRKSTAEKFSMVCSLSQTVIDLSKRAIARANPSADENQNKVLFIRYHYGDDLADQFERYLNLDKNENI